MFSGVLVSDAERQRLAGSYARTWEAWAAELAEGHPGCQVTWRWWDGFTATRPGGETATSCNPAAVRAFLAPYKFRP